MWLPPAERQNELQFYFAKKLPYARRLGTAFGLMAAGWIVQIVLLDTVLWRAGTVLVLAGVFLLLTKGYENRPQISRGRKDWRTATREEVERILTISRKQKKWDQSVLDITCARGFFVLLGIAGLVCFLYFFTLAFAPKLGSFVAINAAVMLLPFWFTGVRFILTNSNLVVKTKLLLELEDYCRKNVDKGDTEFQFQIQTAEATNEVGEVPVDVKAVLLFPGAPSDFLGVQMQVNLNVVQGTSYPYFYCVIVAKESFGSFSDKGPPSLHRDKIVYEYDSTDEVNILVVRQATTKTSGYHTKTAACRSILSTAATQARFILASQTHEA